MTVVPKALLLLEEILILVMPHVGSLSQLKVCRLVCKAWCNPGLINMLGQEIILPSEKGLFRLFHLLMIDPPKGYLIKHINFNNGGDCSLILKELLYLVLTPSIETIKGDVNNEEFYIEFNRAMKRWLERFEKLRTMTTCSEITVPYFEALLHFKNTLQEMTFNIGDYSERIAYDCTE